MKEKAELIGVAGFPQESWDEEVSSETTFDGLSDAEAAYREWCEEQRKAQDEWDCKELKQMYERADSDIWPARRATRFFAEPRILQSKPTCPFSSMPGASTPS